MTIKRFIFRGIFRYVLRVRAFNNRLIKGFAKGMKNKKILEIGSGKKYRGKHYYSVKNCFDDSNEFIMSDIKEEYGHKVVDVTNMDYENEFNVVLCLNVLEHVFNFNQAVENIHKALKPNGVAIIAIPFFYPLHDEPYDYWRFTKYSLERLFKRFDDFKIKHYGLREFPFFYYVEAIKK